MREEHYDDTPVTNVSERLEYKWRREGPRGLD